MDRSLVSSIADAIERDPKSYNQNLFGNFVLGPSREGEGRVIADCRTPCCIAGHAVVCAKGTIKPNQSVTMAARECLQMDQTETIKLFSFCWPSEWFTETDRKRLIEKQDDLMASCGRPFKEHLIPDAPAAAGVLRRVLSGEISLVLEEEEVPR